MSAPALKALAAAKTAGVKITLDGDGLIFEADPLPSDLVALLSTLKPDLLRVLAGREAAKIAINATPPPDCLPRRWTEALPADPRNLRREPESASIDMELSLTALTRRSAMSKAAPVRSTRAQTGGTR